MKLLESLPIEGRVSPEQLRDLLEDAFQEDEVMLDYLEPYIHPERYVVSH